MESVHRPYCRKLSEHIEQFASKLVSGNTTDSIEIETEEYMFTGGYTKMKISIATSQTFILRSQLGILLVENFEITYIFLHQGSELVLK
jgi:hypothetical protein